MSSASLFEAALRDHQAGRVDAALAGYRGVLALDPTHRGALVNLPLALRAAGLDAEALAAYVDAFVAGADVPELWFNYGNVLRELGALLAMSDELDAGLRELQRRGDRRRRADHPVHRWLRDR